jgi:5-(carboxyamino)imidazole ribonucleotide mutase
MQGAFDVLDKEGIGYEFDVRSAHRAPDSVAEYARTARERGLRVLSAARASRRRSRAPSPRTRIYR